MSTPDEVLAAALCTLPNTCIEHHHDAELAIAALAARFVIVPRDATQTDGGPAQPGARPAVTTPPSVANPDEGFAIVRSDELARLRGIEAAAAAHIAWEYRRRGARRFTMTDLRAALEGVSR